MLLRVVDTGTSRQCDREEVRRALGILADPAAGCQLQAGPYWDYATFAGLDLDGMADWVTAQDIRSPSGVYYALNPVRPALDQKVHVLDALSRRWLLVDVDRKKKNETKKLSARDDEKQDARGLASDVADYLHDQNWPHPLIIDSGNGWHLLYRLDLPNDKLTHAMIRSALHALASKFDGDRGLVGKECHDAGRVAKLPGTWACKGQDTEDRPHRMSRLQYVPPNVEIVTAQHLQAIAQEWAAPRANGAPPAARPQSQAVPPPLGVLRVANVGRNYARAALEAECRKMAMCQAGDLNNQLYRSAAALGNLVGGGDLTEHEVYERIMQAGRDAGCDDPAKDADTVRRAIQEGITTPRTAPEPKPIGTSQQTVAAPTPNRPLTIAATAIVPVKVEWLVPGRIPKRFITVMAGRTGLGKSFVTLDLIARMSRGAEIPFARGECFKRGGALIITEDPPEYMPVPRLIEAGADLSLIRFMAWEAMSRYSIVDTAYLERAVSEVPGCQVVVIDPPTNFMGNVDEHKNSEVRQMLMQLVIWLKDKDLATIFIMHVNKSVGKGIEALSRVLGSIAWVSTSRIAHSFSLDPDVPGRCLFIPMKNNLGKLAPGLAYEIVSTEALARVQWISEVDMSADDAMNAPPPKVRRGVVAKDWLLEKFREQREWPSDELFRAARQAGLSRNSLFEAKEILALPRARQLISENGDRSFLWWVPEDWELLTRTDPANQDSGSVGQ